MLWIIACTPPETLTERRLWETIVHLEDNNVVLVRMSQGNTGIYKGLTSLRLSKTMYQDGGPVNEPIEWVMRGTASDSLFTDQSVQIGSQSLTLEDGWNIRIRDSLHNVQATLSNPLPSKIPLIETESWSTDIHGIDMQTDGWLQMGEYSKPLRGRAILLEHFGNRVVHEPQERWVLFLQKGAVILEQSEHSITGFHSTIPTLSSPPNAPLKSGQDSQWDTLSLDIEEMTVLGTLDPHSHVSSIERTLSSSFYPTPELTIGQGVLTVTGPETKYIARYLRLIRGDFN